MNSRDARFEKHGLITISMFLRYWYKFSPKRNILLIGEFVQSSCKIPKGPNKFDGQV